MVTVSPCVASYVHPCVNSMIEMNKVSRSKRRKLRDWSVAIRHAAGHIARITQLLKPSSSAIVANSVEQTISFHTNSRREESQASTTVNRARLPGPTLQPDELHHVPVPNLSEIVVAYDANEASVHLVEFAIGLVLASLKKICLNEFRP